MKTVENGDQRPVEAPSSNAKRLKKIISILIKYQITKGLTPEKLRNIIEELGPTFIKIGQMMSMRRDILPNDYCDELQKLRSDVKPIAYETVINIIEEDYGCSVSSVFKSISSQPLGSASIAQVHEAILNDGSKVVIKVQRPGIFEVMEQDVDLLHHASKILDLASGIGDIVDFQMIIDEMWNTAQKEMNFQSEGDNARRFGDLQKGIKYIDCPIIYDQYTTTKVLVMEAIDGIMLDDREALKKAGYDLEEIGMKLGENYIKQVIEDGFFHADPHPGNIIIRNGQIVWIDLGMMGSLSRREMNLFRRSVKAIVSFDVEALKSVILSLGVQGRRPINHSQLYEAIDRLLHDYVMEDVSNIDMGKFLEDMLKIAGENHIKMPRGISMLSRGIMTLEGVIADIAPSSSVVSIMANHMVSQGAKDFNLQQFITTNSKMIIDSGQKAIHVPGQLSDFLSLANKGQIKVSLEMIGSEEPLREIDKMVNKIVVCIISAAILIGSSFIATTDMTPKIMGIPALGAIGFMSAIILSGGLMISIYRKWKKG